MKSIIKEGKSTQSIISEFMKEYNLTLDDFKFNVIEKGSNGFLNLFGSKPTKIEFIIPETKDIVHKIIEDFLSYVPIKYDIIKVEEKSNGTFYINIIGVDDACHRFGGAEERRAAQRVVEAQRPARRAGDEVRPRRGPGVGDGVPTSG